MQDFQMTFSTKMNAQNAEKLWTDVDKVVHYDIINIMFQDFGGSALNKSD